MKQWYLDIVYAISATGLIVYLAIDDWNDAKGLNPFLALFLLSVVLHFAVAVRRGLHRQWVYWTLILVCGLATAPVFFLVNHLTRGLQHFYIPLAGILVATCLSVAAITFLIDRKKVLHLVDIGIVCLFVTLNFGFFFFLSLGVLASLAEPFGVQIPRL